MREEPTHSAFIDAWLSSYSEASPEALIDTLQAALSALWQRSRTTLGEVTLTAIVDRVLYNAAEQYPLLAPLKIDADGIQCAALRKAPPADRDEFLRAIRSILVEYLSVVGNLTAEILSADLHAELSNVERASREAKK